MDTRVKPAYDEKLSYQLIDPRALSRRQGGEHRRLRGGGAGFIGAAVDLHRGRLRRAGVGRADRRGDGNAGNTAHG